MLEELEYNLWEAILVRLVDYGHTVSPELEMAALRYGKLASSLAQSLRLVLAITGQDLEPASAVCWQQLGYWWYGGLL